MVEAGDGSSGVRSVRRALDILALLSEERPAVSIRDVVEATGLPKTTAIRLVQTLEADGLLWATPRGYQAGPGLWRWAHLARATWEPPAAVRVLMEQLAERDRETVNLYMARDVHRVVVAQQEGPQQLRHVVRVGDELPLWTGAASKVLLIGASPERLERIAAASPGGMKHLPVLRRWAREAAEAGWAVSHGERETGLSAVAAPIHGRDEAVVGALSLSGPTPRFTDERVSAFAADVVKAAEEISDRGAPYWGA